MPETPEPAASSFSKLPDGRQKPRAARNPTVRTARRKLIAKAVINQVAPSVLAKQLGISPQMVDREIKAPETQELIRRWMEPHHAAVRRMIPRALAAVNKGLKPSQEMKDRLQAVKTLGTVMQWAEGRPGDGDSSSEARKFAGSMEELLVLYRRVTHDAPGQPPPEAA